MAKNYIREDQFSIHVDVVGVHFPFRTSWQTKEGGDVESNAVKSHPGGMLGEIALGGPGQRTDCTVKRLFDRQLDSLVAHLERQVGNARMSVSWTPLDADGSPNGKTHVLTGYLKGVNVPNYDANASAAGVLALVMSCDQFQHGAGN